MVSHSNWPSDFAELKKLEDILQCSICYEYINTCLITPCSHNFCSLCIRRYLQFKTQCPTCFEETHGSDLRKNRLIDDVIGIWVKLKDILLFNVKLAAMTQSVKIEPKQCNGVDSPEKHLKSGKKEMITPKTEKGKKGAVQKLFSEKKASPENTEIKSIVVNGMVIPQIFQPQKSPKKSLSKKQEDLSTCPVCNVDIPLRNVNIHLDSCLAASDPASSRLKPKPEKRDPIPKRVYTLMKEKDLKKCLKDYGLNTNGDKKAMIARLSRYIVLYNAECDKEQPRPVSDILKQVEREERDEKATQSNPLFQSTRPPIIPPDKKKDPEAIEKANKEYIDLNRDSFKKLIENMKARDGMNIKPLKPLHRLDSDDENENELITNGHAEASCSNIDKDVICIDSQVIMPGSSNSELDIFDQSPIKAEPGCSKDGLIDWKRTEVNDEPEIDTQVIKHTEEKDSCVILEDNSDSYDSVFNTSSISESAKTPKNKLSLSARKKSKICVNSTESPISSKKMDEKFTEIFDSESEGECVIPRKSRSSVSKESTIVNGHITEEAAADLNEDKTIIETDSSDDSDEDSEFTAEGVCTPTKNYDVSPEISPMKTRSAKRKSQSLGEKTPISESRAARRKRMKPSASPVY